MHQLEPWERQYRKIFYATVALSAVVLAGGLVANSVQHGTLYPDTLMVLKFGARLAIFLAAVRYLPRLVPSRWRERIRLWSGRSNGRLFLVNFVCFFLVYSFGQWLLFARITAEHFFQDVFWAVMMAFAATYMRSDEKEDGRAT